MAESGPKEQITIFGNDRLADRVTSFQQQAQKHQQKQKANPFSGQYDKEGAKNSTGLSKDDPRYGRPPEGSKTEMRGFKAHSHISKEMVELCTIIKEYGTEQSDGTVEITFGELFQMYTVISNKVVGILLRARKHGLLHFEGEMLYQRRDDNVIVTLFPFEEDDEEDED